MYLPYNRSSSLLSQELSLKSLHQTEIGRYHLTETQAENPDTEDIKSHIGACTYQ